MLFGRLLTHLQLTGDKAEAMQVFLMFNFFFLNFSHISLHQQRLPDAQKRALLEGHRMRSTAPESSVNSVCSLFDFFVFSLFNAFHLG